MCILRAILRLLGFCVTYLGFMVIGVTLRFVFAGSKKKHRHYITVFTRYWAICSCFLFNFHVRVIGEKNIAPNALIVANHIGSPDVLVLGSCFRTFFVSKQDLKQWPVVGWLANLGDTVYAERSRRLQVVAIIEAIRSRLEQGFSVALFPEARATDGQDVIAFKSSPFESAVLARRPVAPVMIRYLDGQTPSIACWYKVRFYRHIFMLLKNPRLDVEVHVLPEIPAGENRRDLAAKSHQAIREAHRKFRGNDPVSPAS